MFNSRSVLSVCDLYLCIWLGFLFSIGLVFHLSIRLDLHLYRRLEPHKSSRPELHDSLSLENPHLFT